VENPQLLPVISLLQDGLGQTDLGVIDTDLNLPTWVEIGERLLHHQNDTIQLQKWRMGFIDVTFCSAMNRLVGSRDAIRLTLNHQTVFHVARQLSDKELRAVLSPYAVPHDIETLLASFLYVCHGLSVLTFTITF